MMYIGSTTCTWWDIEDNVGSLASQAVDLWEDLGLPKDAIGVPIVLRAFLNDAGGATYTIGLFHGGRAVYAADGVIGISGASQQVANDTVVRVITESVADLAGDSVAEKLTKGLPAWLRQQ